MIFLPYDSFIINTRFSPEDIKKFIHGFIETKRWVWRWDSDKKQYYGEIIKEKFNIARIIGYRNTLAPIILGEIFLSTNGSIVRIRMRPFGFVIAVM